MRITEISGKGIKGGKPFTLAIEPACVIVGDNRRGKTRIADTVRLALLGCDPRLGDTPGAAMCYASENPMVVRVKLNNGLTIQRTWKKKGNGASVTTQCSDEQLATAVPSVMFDAYQFLRKSKKERSATLFGILGRNIQFDAAELLAKVKAIRVKGHSAEHEKVIREVHSELESLDADRIEVGEDLPSWLAKLVARFKDEESDATAVAKQMHGSAGAAAQIDATRGLATVRVDVDAALRTAREALETMVRENADMKSQIASARASQDTIRGLTAQLDKSATPEALSEAEAKLQSLGEVVQSARNVYTTAENAVGEAQTHLVAANLDHEAGWREQVAVVSTRDQLTASHPRETKQRLAAEIEKLQSDLALIDPTGCGHTLQIEQSKAEQERKRKKIDACATQRAALCERLQGLGQSKASLLSAGRCPTCGTGGANLLSAVQTKFDTAITQAEKELEAARLAADALNAELTASQTNITVIEEAQREITKLRADLSVLMSKLSEEIKAANTIEELDYRVQTATNRVDACAEKVATFSAVLKTVQAARDSARQEENSAACQWMAQRETMIKIRQSLDASKLVKRHTSAIQSVNVECLQTRTADLDAAIVSQRELIAKLEEDQKCLQASRAAEARQAAEAAMLAEADAKKAVLKETNAIIREYQDEVIGKTIKGFLATAGEFFEFAMDQRALAFDDGDLGYWEGHQWVAFEAFCGAEKYLTLAGLALALAEKTPMRVCILDELSTLSKPRRKLVIELAVKMIKESRLDNFIGIDPELDAGGIGYDALGVQVVTVGA